MDHKAVSDEPVKVMIVGAGLGGLTLAMLLERAGVNYTVFERAKEVKPLGSAIMLGANILPLFKQLGLLEEYMSLGKVVLEAHACNEAREIDFKIDFSYLEDMGGHSHNIVARPILYDFLLKQVPKERFLLGKKVLSMEQSKYGVMIRTSDNKTHHGDILVGADGAYSGVRQGLYRHLRDKKELPASDKVPLPFTCVCLVGQTRPLSPEEFPALEEEYCTPHTVIGVDKPYSWVYFNTKGNTLCWRVQLQLDEVSSKEHDSFMNSEWGPEAAEAMCKDVRDFPIRGGKGGQMTVGDLIDRTPKELISKVMLEEKIFDTWYSGRTVLMGDAVHKMNPAGAQGAINAMQDAIALANWINVLPSTEVKDCEKIFKEYKAERYPQAKKSFDTSQMMGKLMGKTISGTIVRFASKHMPAWLQKMALAKNVANRPQVSFLPVVEDLGSVPALPQQSLIKTAKILKQREEENAAKAKAQEQAEEGPVEGIVNAPVATV